MQYVLVHNLSRPMTKPVMARYCATFFCRLRGLTFRSSLPASEGLLLVQRNDSRVDAAIHMLGVFMDLAVTWINSSDVVVDVCVARAWRLMYIPKAPARYVLEIPLARSGDFQIGDQIRFEEVGAA
jgi:uncharacterized membrane protein (UPF0127 family)